MCDCAPPLMGRMWPVAIKNEVDICCGFIWCSESLVTGWNGMSERGVYLHFDGNRNLLCLHLPCSVKVGQNAPTASGRESFVAPILRLDSVAHTTGWNCGYGSIRCARHAGERAKARLASKARHPP